MGAVGLQEVFYGLPGVGRIESECMWNSKNKRIELFFYRNSIIHRKFWTVVLEKDEELNEKFWREFQKIRLWHGWVWIIASELTIVGELFGMLRGMQFLDNWRDETSNATVRVVSEHESVKNRDGNKFLVITLSTRYCVQGQERGLRWSKKLHLFGYPTTHAGWSQLSKVYGLPPVGWLFLSCGRSSSQYDVCWLWEKVH